MSFWNWLIEAMGEAGVDRALFGLTAPLQRWIFAHVISRIWGRIRRDFQQEYAAFLAMSRQRRAGLVAFLLSFFPPLWIASAMGDSAPYSLQIWVGAMGMFIFGAAGWFVTRDVVRWIRRRAKPPALC